MKKFISILMALTFAAALTVGSSAALLGDVNKDGKISITDVFRVADFAINPSKGF